MKNKTFLFIIVVFIVGIIVYLNPALMYKNYIIKNHIDSLSKQSSVSTTDLIPFDYDQIHIIYPYSSKEDIENQIGIKSRFIRENQNDNYQTLIVIKNKEIIAATNVLLYYNFQPLHGYNYIVNKSNSKIIISENNSGYSFIEQYNSIEDTYLDISYNLPGSYNEEDDEEDGKFYYTDIDNEEYLLVKILKDFDYNKYIKDKNIVNAREESLNNWKIYYFEEIKENTTDINYIVKINNENYIFILNSKNKNLESNKDVLNNIIQTIKE